MAPARISSRCPRWAPWSGRNPPRSHSRRNSAGTSRSPCPLPTRGKGDVLTRVRAQRSRSPRFLQHSRLPSSRPSPTLGLKPVPFPRVPGSLALGQCAQGSRSQRADEEAGSEFKANFASAARSAAPRARQGGRRRALPRRQPVARPPGTRARPLAARSLTSLPPPTTWSRPARGGLGAARQPAHMHMRATERAACIPERAPRARTPTLARARRYRRY